MPSANPPSFADLLRQHRLAAGLTQDALAEKAGLSANGIQKLERGNTRPYRDTASRLMQALQLAPQDETAFRAAAQPLPRQPRSRPEPPAKVRARHNLPVALSSFIGRQGDLAGVRERLQASRLLTLTGVGGCGKTRLALELAMAVLPTYEDGVWEVELAPLADAALLPQAVGSVIGVREQPNQTPSETLVAAVQRRHLLLVLDNCEHLLDGCAALADTLLRACPQVAILATSREPLAIAGETVWRVPALALPDRLSARTWQQLVDCEAVRLFVERAQAVQPAFRITERNALHVAEVCTRLDGLPLAIELAAARVRMLGIEEILEQLDDSLRLLVGGGRMAPSRQQTIRAALDWSHDLLTEAERAVFRRLAVFAGGWNLEAAESVCAGDPIKLRNVLDVLTSLVDKSVVVAEELGERSRYRLLEPIREYAQERLLQSGELGVVRQQHADWFVALSDQWDIDANIGGPRRLAATDALEREQRNLQTTLRWCVETNNPYAGLRLARPLQHFWQARGHFTEGLSWLGQLLELPADTTPASTRAMALVAAGRLATLQGDHVRARAFYDEGLPLARQGDELWVLWAALTNLGLDEHDRGSYEPAKSHFTEALECARRAAHTASEAISLNNLATLAYWQGDAAEARSRGAEAARLARSVGDIWVTAFALCTVGYVALWEHDRAAARGALPESLALFQGAGERWGTAIALEGLGHLAAAERDYEAARGQFVESLLIRQQLGDRQGIAASFEALASLAARQGQTERALVLAGAAEWLRETTGGPLSPVGRQLLERWLVPLQQELSDDSIASAWAQGRALGDEQAMVVALGSVNVASSGAPRC